MGLFKDDGTLTQRPQQPRTTQLVENSDGGGLFIGSGPSTVIPTQQGIPGPVGPQGPEGPSGPTGPAGAQGDQGIGIQSVTTPVNPAAGMPAVSYTHLTLPTILLV